MYRPTIKSNLWLGLMTVAFLLLALWAERSRVKVRPDSYQIRLEAAHQMDRALRVLEEYRLPGVERVATDETVDPLVFTMLGEKDSPITTDEGRIEDKITVLNPNFAAVVVDLFDKAGLKRGDTIAVMMTGSMPGANLAVFAACRAMNLNPVIITSIGSSWWGANMPDFTWLDMERVLLESNIFAYRSSAASAGGSDDHGGLRMTDQGRMMIREAAGRNEVMLIEEGSLSANIQGRLRIFERFAPINRYKAVVNIGGGIAAIGHHENAFLIPNGFTESLPGRNYPGRGVLHHFSDAGVPVVQIADVTELARNYNLPLSQLPLPKVGVGLVFERDEYNLRIAGIALLIMFFILAVVKYYDRKRYLWREQPVDADMEI